MKCVELRVQVIKLIDEQTANIGLAVYVDTHLNVGIFCGCLSVSLCVVFLPGMLKQGSGHIVNTSSVFGIVPVPFETYYCAAKFALNGLMDSLRFEVSK